MYTLMYAYAHTYKCAYMHILIVYIYIYIYKYIYKYIYISSCIYTCIQGEDIDEDNVVDDYDLQVSDEDLAELEVGMYAYTHTYAHN